MPIETSAPDQPLVLQNTHNTDRYLHVTPLDKDGEISLRLPEDLIYLTKEQAFQLAAFIVAQLQTPTP